MPTDLVDLFSFNVDPHDPQWERIREPNFLDDPLNALIAEEEERERTAWEEVDPEVIVAQEELKRFPEKYRRI